jgi:hypothetical protein
MSRSARMRKSFGGEWLDGKTCPVVGRSGNSGVPDTGEGLGRVTSVLRR